MLYFKTSFQCFKKTNGNPGEDIRNNNNKKITDTPQWKTINRKRVVDKKYIII